MDCEFITVRFQYGNITRRGQIPKNCTLEQFREFVYRKTGQSFRLIVYKYDNELVHVYDEEDFRLGLTSGSEPEFVVANSIPGLRLNSTTPTAPNGLDTAIMAEPPEITTEVVTTKDEKKDLYTHSTIHHVSPGGVSRGPGRLPRTQSPMLTFYQLGTVRRLYEEYEKGLDGKPSLRMLDEKYGSEWRRDHYQAYIRRIKIVREIQRRGKEVGVDKAIEELEQLGSLYKVIDVLKERSKLQRQEETPMKRKRDEAVNVDGINFVFVSNNTETQNTPS